MKTTIARFEHLDELMEAANTLSFLRIDHQICFDNGAGVITGPKRLLETISQLVREQVEVDHIAIVRQLQGMKLV
jgi:hypothetical protein